jgi:PAS domain S-box-containing protein
MPEEPGALQGLDTAAALQRVFEGTAADTGEAFFRVLVQNLAEALGVNGAWVTEYLEATNQLRALAFHMDGDWIDGYAIDLAGTPCERVIASQQLVHFPDQLLALYPDDPDIRDAGFVSYMGIALKDVDGRILGHLAVIDRRPMPESPGVRAIFQIFAARAAAELRRLRREEEIRLREEKLSSLVDSALDAILELDGALHITRANPAAAKVFGCPAEGMTGESLFRFLSPAAAAALPRLVAELDSRPRGQQSLWVPGGLDAVRADGTTFPAEATLARYHANDTLCHCLILRSLHDRMEAERRIQVLAHETENLRRELHAPRAGAGVIGESPALRAALRDVEQVAGTDATVLLLGETGTGKGLFAQALHQASARAGGPLITVNCAAIPATLMESEFFGHEKGAFTGATERRRGRFALADGGTIFLDEVGELPLELQAKLLRVLQDGAFEPVGDARTVSVDVRVVAATNRNLQDAVRAGTFREDLFYRLNVFPIAIPPLRERGGDIAVLARAFTERFARRLGRALAPPDADDIRRLRAYAWPGNVRELENVIERAVITACDGRLNLDRALPESGTAASGAVPARRPGEVLTAEGLRQLERENLRAALEQCGWRVSGAQGAARLLGINPSTLNSRIRALGLARPGA